MNMNFDIIVIGAGSVGVPIALYLAEKKFSVLVIESLASPGQGQNKKAIGGIRATHSDKAKIHISLESIDIFSTWKEMYGGILNGDPMVTPFQLILILTNSFLKTF